MTKGHDKGHKGQMSDREAMKLALNFLEDGMPADMWGMDENGYQNAIAALRQALEQQEQKPVAWSVLDKRTGKHWYTHESKSTAQYYANLYSHRETDGSPSMVVTPLYTAPPKREWKGMTDKEIQQVVYDLGTIGDLSHDEFDIARAVAQALKERNT